MRAIVMRHGKVDFQWKKWSTSEQFNKDCQMYDDTSFFCSDFPRQVGIYRSAITYSPFE